MMGYKTPNIDRIANEGLKFTDYYSEQSCTAGRSAFITGQSVFRTGLSKVGVPGSPSGLSKKDPTIAELLKPQGYVTGQFGKNHLGDKDEFLSTNHGFLRAIAKSAGLSSCIETLECAVLGNTLWRAESARKLCENIKASRNKTPRKMKPDLPDLNPGHGHKRFFNI
jgi:arylsulfatase A-like enzyme